MIALRSFLLSSSICLALASWEVLAMSKRGAILQNDIGNKIKRILLTNANESVLTQVSKSVAERVTYAVKAADSSLSTKAVWSNDAPLQVLPSYMRDRQGLRYDVLEYQLHVAVATGDYNEVTELLATDQVGVDDFDRRGRTPLHIAIETGNLNMVALLVINGANIETKIANERWHYEHEFSEQNNKNKVVRNTTPNSEASTTPIGLAIQGEHHDILALLIMAGADVEKATSVSHNGKYATMTKPASIVASRGDLASLILLDVAGAELLNSYNPTLNHAVAGEHAALVEFLLEARLPPEQQIIGALKFAESVLIFDMLASKLNYLNSNLMHDYALKGKHTLVAHLIDEYGFDPDAINNYGDTALHLALKENAKGNRKSTIANLLKRGADPFVQATNSTGITPITLAIKNGMEHLFVPYLTPKQLLEVGITMPDGQGREAERDELLTQLRRRAQTTNNIQ